MKNWLAPFAFAFVVATSGCSSSDTDPQTSTSSSSAATGGSCPKACKLDATSCEGNAVKTCIEDAGCPAWSEAVACDEGETCDGGACKPPPCSGEPGTYHAQAFESGDETRHYYLHVPDDYSCDVAGWPLLVDFHGTGFGAEDDPVEESWALPELLEAADSEHFIVVRPRSRSKESTGGYVFQWDVNGGDLDLNHDFVTGLVADLETRYHIDASRVYALGFSNGPNMALQFLADEPSIFHGYAAVAGGLNYPLAGGPTFDASAPRIYETTGFRDYMLSAQRNLADYLDEHGYPAASLFDRESDTGHELYGWHYHEAFGWMDRNERPSAGALQNGWAVDPSFTEKESLIQLAAHPSGDLYATATGGAIYRHHASSWTRVATLTGRYDPALSGICFLDSGAGFAVGDGVIATSTDGSDWTVAPQVPEFGPPNFGFTYATTVACGGSRVTVAGVWSAATTTDGTTWSAASLDNLGSPAFASMIKQGDTGTFIGLGYWNYIGRSTDGITFTPSAAALETQWYNDVAAAPSGQFWVVGEKGTILHSPRRRAELHTRDVTRRGRSLRRRLHLRLSQRHRGGRARHRVSHRRRRCDVDRSLHGPRRFPRRRRVARQLDRHGRR